MHWKFWLPILAIPVIYLAVALSLTLIRPEVGSAGSLNFERLISSDNTVEPTPLQTFETRDGQALSFAHYPSDSNLKVILLHGSGYHGAYLAPLADYLASTGIGDVYVPNVRGHLGSGNRRGDIDYIGQLEDDIDEVAALILQENPDARICIGGHSSGGALAMRYASGEYGSLIYCFFGLAPFLGPDAPTIPETDSGWAHISLPRIIGLSMLNTVGIHALDGLETIRFNLPEPYRDGTETLGYSWRLMTNFALNRDFEKDVAGLPGESIVFVGSDDEALNAEAFVPLFSRLDKQVQVIDGLDHFGIVLDEGVMQRLGDWLAQH
ncbi:alpha/beta hydrolase [Hoeflea poritis]|uniref:Alpha/beta fold hydrolase n=1 Tax=Hoeflea poritis TaxID=2993659 RepID=A0ABT4VI61_9HYPH|nr:alpha/beta fold hydrolase [Hoeflea poritis]MDA4843743.1 alpha/beta fold hydrolase [Hoeflea poritis]